MYLADGTCVVPVLEELAAHLPALRSASSTKEAKQLQSSSHRGICSIQRALTSIAEMAPEEALPARTLLRDASRQGAFLREVGLAQQLTPAWHARTPVVRVVTPPPPSHVD